MKLSGVKVLDFSQFLAGPMISAIMADHGADVIKVEAPGGDPTRRVGRKEGESAGGFYRVCNRGKRGMALDLKRGESRAIVERLIRCADVFIESYSPGVTQRLGIDYATVSAWNPRLVYCSVTSFGQTGALRDLGSHDPVVQAMAGIYPRDGKDAPVQPNVSTAGLTTAYNALAGILMALLAARESGQGDYLDISMHDVALTLRPQIQAQALAALQSPHSFHYESGVALLECYQAADGEWLSLGGREPRFAKALFEALGRLDLLPLATGSASGAAQNPVREFLRATFASQPRQHWLNFLGDKLSIGPVLNYAEALALPHVADRDMIVRDGDGRTQLNTPLHFAREAGRPNLRVPDVGQDTVDVLRASGFSEASIHEFLSAGVVFGGTHIA